ncbi:MULTISPECIES: OmpA family protein [Rodentibacter]|uniref:OmpA family protein n=1 Tax=Rodentibacter TaxID=1960084 RepID=UPI001CFD4F74|nr:OmpA family protein [Rodentibacter sp. JRC1]GJI56492.1 hypothetical protein HEMROJRC1_16040 [Rodentibacter sp. JRC1]
MIDLSKLTQKNDDDSQWLPISDLMSGLMILFLFIAISFMRNIQMEKQKIEEVALTYQQNQVAIYETLINEFKDDLISWNAEIDQDLTFVFKSPDVLFNIGKSDLNTKYRKILSDFFPRYLNAIQPYLGSINEIRIEGHTSSHWNKLVSDDEAYFLNMALSQERTRSVLKYVYELESIGFKQRNWIKSHLAAVGLSSSKTIIENGLENEEKSRRVSFRIITNADIQIKKIIEMK